MQCFKIVGRPVLEKIFYHTSAWQPSWSCDLDHLYKLSSPPLPKEAPQEIWHRLAGQLVSEKKAFENNGHKHVYSPGAGADNSLGSNLFQKGNSSVNLVICCKFYPLRRSASNNWQISTSCLYLVE